MSAVEHALGVLAPLSLAELEGRVALLERTDRKHLVALEAVAALVERLQGSHRALELGGRRAFAYDSVYLDTPDLLTARAHVQGRRRRFKCRTRHYVDAGTCWFELKQKGPREQTVKRRIPHPADAHGRLTAPARAFLAEHLDRVPDLVAVLRTTYTRMTLAGPGERVTIDLDVAYDDDAGGRPRLRPGWAIVETKSARGDGPAERELRRLGSRPLPLSKYLLGAAMTRMPAVPNDSRRVARRFFEHA
jgi:hypothetical protein